jgi:hypothetical protein
VQPRSGGGLPLSGRTGVFCFIAKNAGWFLMSRLQQSVFSLRLLLLHLSRKLNHSPNCFSTRWKIDLNPAPLINSAQKTL